MRSQFNDVALYDLAMTHRSMHATDNNQRLEFLGDRVLGLVIADMLYDAYPHEREGDLAMRLAALVCTDTLANVARTIALDKSLHMADGEAANGGRNNISNIADACEALIGAIYKDQGLAAAKNFIHTHWQSLLHSTHEPPKDSKTRLQEWAQAQALPLPVYHETARHGPDHAPEFTIEVMVEGYDTVQACGASKREAQQLAAQALLDKYA